MIKRYWFWMGMILALVLSGCSQVGGAKIEDTCLVGKWMVESDEVLGRALLPSGAFIPEDLRYKDVMGVVGYAFSEDGVLTFQAVEWSTRFDVVTDKPPSLLVLQLSGVAAADFSVEGDRITVDKVTDDSTSFIAIYDDVEMLNTNKVEEFAPLFFQAARTGQYTCQADTLKITFTDPAGSSQMLTFLRVKPTQ
jgi:hypothetical protein